MPKRKQYPRPVSVPLRDPRAFIFERRVRALIRHLQRLYPKLSRADAMARARQVAPKRLPHAIHAIKVRLALAQRRGMWTT